MLRLMEGAGPGGGGRAEIDGGRGEGEGGEWSDCMAAWCVHFCWCVE